MSPAAATLTASPSPSSSLSNEPRRDDFAVAHSHLIRRLLELHVPKAVGEVSDHIKEAANLFDEWLFAIGGAVQGRVNADLDFRVFQGAFLGAVEGDAAYAVKVVVEESARYRTLRRAR